MVEDIETLLVNGVDEVDDDCIGHFATSLASVIRERLKREAREPGLRMSNIGKPCDRALWYEINLSSEKEPLRAEHYLKFLYGDILEELMLFLAELAGHEVKGRQDEQEIAGIKGHRDAVIDGVIVDVKSASSNSFKKFANGTLAENDSFGYIGQIQSYLHAGQEDEQVTDKTRAAFLVVDKTLGHITLDIHPKDENDWVETFEEKKTLVASEEIPERGFEPVPYGTSGNLSLGFNCSYCPFKRTCYPELRTFLYAHKPVDLVHVARLPLVPEITYNGGQDTQENE